MAAAAVQAQLAPAPPAAQTTATIPAGVPLRVVLEQRVPVKRAKTPVRGLLLAPVYVYDRMVLPAGSVVEGRISRVEPVRARVRLLDALSGNFAPPRKAEARFDTLVLGDGRRVPLQTAASSGAAYVNDASRPRKQQLRAAASLSGFETCLAAACALTPASKMARLRESLFGRLPYRRQAWKTGTLFTSILQQPLVAPVPVSASSKEAISAAGGIDGKSVTARLLTALNSATARRGMAVVAVVTRPQFSADHKLLIPEGAILRGEVLKARGARWLHRNGRILFAFRELDLPRTAAKPIQGYLEAAQVNASADLVIDSEGSAHVTNSATRFIFPAIAAAVAGLSFHQDYNAQGIPDQDVGGRAESGAVGLGLIGTVVAQSPRLLASGIAVMGAGLGVYSNLIARGRNAVFPVNTYIEVGLTHAGPIRGRAVDDPARRGGWSGPHHRRKDLLVPRKQSFRGRPGYV